LAAWLKANAARAASQEDNNRQQERAEREFDRKFDEAP